MQEEKNKISLNDKIVNFVSNNIVWVFLGFIVIVIILPRLFIKDSPLGIFNGLKANEIGDAIGGMTAPIIGLFSSFLVYIAFREQVIANRMLKEQNIHNTIDRHLKIIENIRHDIQSFKININPSVYNKATYLRGIESIEHIFTLLNPGGFMKADIYLRKHYEDIIRTYLLSLRIIQDIKELDSNINEKILLLNKLTFLKTNNLSEIEIIQNFKKGTFGEDEYKLKVFIKDNLLKILNEFNDEYNKTYNLYITKLINPLPKIN
ncbi:MAG: hypothetical protein IPM95_03245 [Sphingobacteriales bacterium]|nr:hypothetical protein [Sphingobacteriales bacterium]